MAFGCSNSMGKFYRPNAIGYSARSTVWGLALSVGLGMSAAAQTIEFTVREAKLGGVKLNHVEGQLRSASQQPKVTAISPDRIKPERVSSDERPPDSLQASSETVDLALAFDFYPDSFIDTRNHDPLPIQLRARLDPRHWQISVEPLLISVGNSEKNAYPIGPDLATPEAGLWSADLRIGATIFGNNEMMPTKLRVQMETANLNYTDISGSVAAEGISANTEFFWQASRKTSTSHFASGDVTLTVESTQGALLADSVFIDFATHPFQSTLSGQLHSLEPLHATLHSAHLEQLDLLTAKVSTQTQITEKTDRATASLTASLLTDIDFHIEEANIELVSLEFPAAYQSFFRTALAGSLLGNLHTTGSLSGGASIRDNTLQSGTLLIRDVSLLDQRTQALSIQNLAGTLHWESDRSNTLPKSTRISSISWSSAVLNDIPAQASELHFLWSGNQITQTEPTRIPILDGALRIDTFRATNIAMPNQEIWFDGSLEPVSLATLTRALGWPEFGGTLTGRAPGVRYQDGRLTLSGALEADVFGGRVSGTDLVIVHPFSRWPRMAVDITLNNLDLTLLTSTFDIGAISGRVSGEISDLELFGWKPVTFDASISTVEQASDPKRISVRAINSIANIGGSAGSGVTAALQGGLLRFFDSYRYRRLGLRCILRDDVCWMSGTGPDSSRFGDRYTLLEGAGLPRLHIIGYSGRVNWSQLVEQISTQIRSGASLVRAP